jgi:hypothetical protein
MGWLRYKSLDEDRPRVACKACGHANVRHPRFEYRACARCFNDVDTGLRHPSQVVTAVLFLVGSFAISAMFGAFVALVMIQLPLDIFYGLDLPHRAGTREVVAPIVTLIGVAAGIWLAARLRRK